MEISKLFHVLVVGGAVFASVHACAGGAEEDSEDNPEQKSGEENLADGAVDTPPDADAGQSVADASVDTKPSEVICPGDDYCEVIEGEAVVRDGFVCCWSTSC